jgi:hypothetical protein
MYTVIYIYSSILYIYRDIIVLVIAQLQHGYAYTAKYYPVIT